ncbi:MAG: hypothetical protein Q9224_006994, partial [Gallowayella concinna]
MISLAVYSNITISAPLGTSQHGRKDFLCFPSKWYTVLGFFVVNYLTHAFTLWRKPGEKSLEYGFAAILSLFFPIAGAGRGLDAIYRHASWQATWGLLPGLLGFGDSEYEKRTAAKAAKSSSISHFEYNGENWHAATLRARLPGQATGIFDLASAPIYSIVMDAGQGENPDCMRTICDISGLVWLHESSSYIVMELPVSHAEHIKMTRSSTSAPETEVELALAKSSSLPQTLIAILQIAYASYTLARNTGDEIERNGYTSFSLSIIPYIIMSFVNLIGNLATPSYPCVYLVATSTMDEAQKRGNVISGQIGYIPDKYLKTVDGSELLQVVRVNCRNTVHNSPAASRRATSNNLRSINVCFEKHCQSKDSHQNITVASGKPRAATGSHAAEFFFKCLVGLPLIIAIPIILVIFVHKKYPTKPSLQATLPVVL